MLSELLANAAGNPSSSERKGKTEPSCWPTAQKPVHSWWDSTNVCATRYRVLMAILDVLDWGAVRQHYDDRVNVSRTLVKLQKQNAVTQFADLALGISDIDGNYSAAEHHLGPKILYPQHNLNAAQRIFDLAATFAELKDARTVPDLISLANLRYLKIGVGSEISCMMNPNVCWVANTRTIWTHLVIKHNDNIETADKHLQLYRDSDGTSEMDYQMWAAIHAELRVALTRIAEDGQAKALKKKLTPGTITYIWADAIASALYGEYHD